MSAAFPTEDRDVEVRIGKLQSLLWIGIVVLLLVATRSFAAQSPAADSKKQAVHSAVEPTSSNLFSVHFRTSSFA